MKLRRRRDAARHIPPSFASLTSNKERKAVSMFRVNELPRTPMLKALAMYSTITLSGAGLFHIGVPKWKPLDTCYIQIPYAGCVLE